MKSISEKLKGAIFLQAGLLLVILLIALTDILEASLVHYRDGHWFRGSAGVLVVLVVAHTYWTKWRKQVR